MPAPDITTKTTSIARLSPIWKKLHEDYSKAIKMRLADTAAISSSALEDVQNDAMHIDDKLLSLEPTCISEAALQLEIALSCLCLEWGEKLEDQDEWASEYVKAAQKAVVDLWRFSGVRHNA
jgi:hypothetical protein